MGLARSFLAGFGARTPRMAPLPRGAFAPAAPSARAAAPARARTVAELRTLFLADFQGRDALRNTRGVVNADSLRDIAWELGYEAPGYAHNGGPAPEAQYQRLFARYEPLAAAEGVDLRAAFQAGMAAA